MRYLKMSIKDAMTLCGEHTEVLVAIENLESGDCNEMFQKVYKEEYNKLFSDVKTVASMCDDIMKQLQCFTVKQDIYNIKPNGLKKVIILRE